MVEGRPDWCVSRQRAWGVPIAVFIHRETGEPLRDPAVVERVAAAVEREGADVWFSADPAQFLGNAYDPAEWEKVTDIVEVWFDSGSTHAFVLEQRPELRWPASLYLEGSDQHRGWFHSSLLEACGTRGRAPYEAVLTHGFVLDEQGRKMSKSLGNVVAPQDVMKQSGADILRLWVVGSDYSEDLRIGPEILKHHSDVYRRLRNTLRYLLGALDGFTAAEAVGIEAMPELERWVLHRLAELDALVRRAVEDFDFHGMFTALHNFCAVDLSAFYFDIRKDRLYCDAPDDPRRRAVRTVLDRYLRLPGALAGAGPLLHRRGGLARPPWRRARAQRPSRTVPRCPGRLARPGARRALGEAARSAPRRHRRARARARRQAARLEPAGRGRGFRSGEPGRNRCAASTWPSCASPRPARSGRGRCPRAPSPCPTWPISASWCRRRRASAASAAGGCLPEVGHVAGPCRSLPPLCRRRRPRRAAAISAAVPSAASRA